MSATPKHPDLIRRTEEPLNAGMPLRQLIETEVTPVDRFFVRGHAPVPSIDPAAFRLSVDGRVERPAKWSLADLKRFPRRTVLATLQCAGNRRREMLDPAAMGCQVGWDAEAIGTARWGGVTLRDVLVVAGVAAGEALHVAFTGLDEVEEGDSTAGFGGSIPLTKALSPEVLLVTEMNGQPLPPVHGGPLRVIVPGFIGARSVKWLGRITVQDDPSDNRFQTRAYKIFPPHVRADTVDWTQGQSLGEYPVNTVICDPAEGDALPAGPVTVRGYAVSGGNRTVERVDVSVDGGATWAVARLLADQGHWAWRLWDIALDLPPGAYTLIARAWDSAGTTQPEHVGPIWNFKGYLNNAWHRVAITVGRDSAPPLRRTG